MYLFVVFIIFSVAFWCAVSILKWLVKEETLKYSEFRRWLIAQGAELIKAPGGGSHRKVRLNGRQSVFPDHGSKEMPEPLRKKIIKDLGL
ncbi:type II toxin-antitoxin system HicA family toxin [Providencia hangzhouensis]|uniref:type II toxin-antitoxin system HicA family toxin n=1 Tax=Providencia hangzhouensis TaxID=3031799 RepID=UPI00397DC5DC